MRIGFDVTPLCTPMSGVGTYTVNLLEHLERLSGDEIVRLAHRTSPVNGPGDRNGQAAVPINGRRPGLNKTVWMQLVLPRQLRHLCTDVCHFTNGVASFWTPCPSVVTIHDMTLWLFPEYHYRRRLLAMRPFVPLAARRAAAIIAVSEATKADVVRILGVEASKVHVVHEAPSRHFRPLRSEAQLQTVRRRYGLPHRFVLYVGTIEPRKNLVRLVEAYARLRASRDIAHGLVFVGRRGWKDEAVFAAVERLELDADVRFLGYVPAGDLVALYNLADVVAFPSLYEGFGLPVLEAMACGTPVVTSPNGSLREVAGCAAEFVDPCDVDSIAEGLWRVLRDTAHQEELGACGLARAACFSWDRAARQTRQIYAEIMGDGNNGDD
jgi:glycosyltransferase involved in cell wall biosynthesis